MARSGQFCQSSYSLCFMIKSCRQLPACPAGVDCVNVVVSHYARYDHSLLARHSDLGLINWPPGTSVQANCLTNLLLKYQNPAPPPSPGHKFSSTRILPSKPVDPAAAPVRFATPRAQYISPIKVIRRSSQQSQKSKSFKCDICDRTFNSENAYEEHVCA